MPELAFPRRAFRVAAVNLAILLALALAVELIFGSWVFGPNFGNLSIPRKVSRVTDTTGLYKGAGKVLYERDQFGLRGPYESPATLDIVTMGGSTTNEKYLNEEDTWTGVLRARFAQSGMPLQVANASIDGHSTAGHIHSFDIWFPLIPDFRPRYVIAYIGINDVAVTETRRNAEMRPKDPFRRLRYFFVNNSALHYLFRTLRGTLRAHETKLFHGAVTPAIETWAPASPQPDVAAHRAENQDRLTAYADRIRVLASRIRDIGAKPIFVTQPRGDYRIRDGKLHSRVTADGLAPSVSFIQITLFNAQLMETCAGLEGVICVDLAAELAFEDGDVYDNIHTTPQGSRRVGEALFRRLRAVITPRNQ